MALMSHSRSPQGRVILSYGFRPFFLAGALQAALSVVLWLPMFLGDLQVPTAFSPLDWHIHEMLYGYLSAIIAGFLLTAIPNWTGRPQLQGSPLALLVLVWLAGRLAILLSQPIGPVIAGGVDCLFLVLLAAVAAREVSISRNWKNLPPVGLLLMFVAGDATFRVEAYRSGSADFGKRIGIATAIMLVALIGGRVIPSFTRNWLVRENPGRLPIAFGPLDAGVLSVSAFTLTLWVGLPEWPATAVLMIAAGAGQAVRLARWAGDRTLQSPLVLILHIAYPFIPAGFVLLGGAVLRPEDIAVRAGIHAWTVGVIGIMSHRGLRRERRQRRARGSVAHRRVEALCRTGYRVQLHRVAISHSRSRPIEPAFIRGAKPAAARMQARAVSAGRPKRLETTAAEISGPDRRCRAAA